MQERTCVRGGRLLARVAHAAGGEHWYLDIGLVGYHSHRRIVDPLGLANSRVALYVRSRDFAFAYSHYRPDDVLHNPVFFPDYLGKAVREAWFEHDYRPVATLDSGRPDPIVVYRRIRTRAGLSSGAPPP